MTKDHEAFGVHPTIPFRLLNKQEMANLLGCTIRTIDRLIAARKIPFLRIPCGVGNKTKIRFDSRDIEKWLIQDHHDAVDQRERLRRLMGMD